MNNQLDIASVVDIEVLSQLFGLPTYGFFKRRVGYHSDRYGKNGHHISHQWEETTREEYVANVEKSRELRLKQFYGVNGKPFRESYWEYEQRLVTPGWPQVLIQHLEQYGKLEPEKNES